MRNRRIWLFGLLFVLLIIGVGYSAFSFLFLDEIVDYWWFSSLGYKEYFFRRLFYRYLILSGVACFMFLLFFINFWIASRYLGSTPPVSDKTGKSGRLANLKVFEMFRTGSMTVYIPLSIILSIFIALPLFKQWESFLFYLLGPNAGVSDPTYGIDVSFYLFTFPIYALLQQRLLIVFLILLTASSVLYLIEQRILFHSAMKIPRGAKLHLNFLATMSILLYGWGYLLDRYSLLYDTNHMPLFFGPGFTQMNVQLPLIWASIIFWLLFAFSLQLLINFKKGRLPVIVFALLFFSTVGIKSMPFLPNMVQKYVVIPNELSKEKPYIQKNVSATLAAYNLTDVETREFSVEQLPWTETAKEIEANIQNIPVWDPRLLDDVYNQLQGIRPYYKFTGVDVDRYRVENSYQQVNLAARELSIKDLPDYAKSWINEHLQYTHGYGLVMTPAAQSGEAFMSWYIEGIEPTSQFGFTVSHPGIYYGLGNYTYAIAPNEVGEMDYPKGNSFVTTNYEGKAGVGVSSFSKKMLFASYFKDRNIFYTTKTTDNSKILFRQNIQSALKVLTPFLSLDNNPYLVVTGKDLFWIQDAYTTSGWYPHAASYEPGKNYIRNSVKIAINAYDGTIDLYLSDPKDPIIRAYDRIYPGLFKPFTKMPDDLKQHIRYPKDIFKAQMGIYAKYHQTNPETFYRQEDIWEFAQLPKEKVKGSESHLDDAYYLTLNLIEKDRKDFLLLTPMCPKNRPNLRALAIAGCDKDHYGKFYVYSFSKGKQVYGPAQINALINQDTIIAEQFTLWDQTGSEVIRGRMIILPIGNVVFYIQPVYLVSSAQLKIPQLQRLIVSQGAVVVMEDSLEKAFQKIEHVLKNKIQQEIKMPEMPEPKTGLPPDTSDIMEKKQLKLILDSEFINTIL